MFIKILGTAPGFSQLNKAHSSLWIEMGDNSFLLDSGEGTMQQILKYKLDLNTLNSIIISHFHPDHISGLFMILQNMHIMGRSKALSLFIPEDIDTFMKTLKYFYLFPERFNFKLDIFSVEKISNSFPEIIAIKNSHLDYLKKYQTDYYPIQKFNSFSFAINHKVVYTSDVNSLDHLRNYFEYPCFIVDGYHLPASELKDLNEKHKKKSCKIVLTHGVSQEILDWLNCDANKSFELANDGKEINI